MKKIEIIRTTLEHLRELRPDDYEKFVLRDADPVYTGLYKGKVIFVSGVVITYPGMGEAWNVMCSEIRDYIGAFREIKKLLEWAIDEHGLRRVESHVRENDQVSLNFDKHLGFEVEGLCRKWGPDGEDFILMGRVR